ncbi:Protein of unknown function [Streptomyces aidingensis]|uniref:Putative antitoxin VapB45-like DNA-binding HTH domain-containing protein n=2 Tax=Streptomyces aidingensis TaxID=910347 RepID=A0A1I1TKD5_9ACTN|nr:Protein of unknown function [Streptomyces aidingensis]
MVTATSDIRFDVPLYTQTHAAHYLDMPPSTFRSWAQGYHNRFRNRPPVHGAPLITYLGEPHSPQPSIPFIGLAEGMFLSALRRADVPMQQIRPALELVRERLGVQYALASKRLYAVGAQLLFEVSEGQDLDRTERREARKLIVLKNGQYVFREVVEKYMRNIHYDDGDGYAARLHLPGYEVAEVMAEPQVNFGQPYFTATGTPLYAVAGRLRAGDTVEETAEDFDLPVDQVAELSERVERGVA